MDNTEQNGEELLQRIVESCKTNTESNIKTQESLEDFTALLLECEHSLRSGFALNEEIFGVQKNIERNHKSDSTNDNSRAIKG